MRLLLVVLLALSLFGCSAGGELRSASAPESSSQSGNNMRKRAKIRTELASMYFQQNKMVVALDEIRKALEADSKYSSAYNVRGMIQMYLRENEAAEESFLRAIELAPNDPEVSNNYGWFLCQTGRVKESMSYFMASVRNTLYPTPEKSYINAGLCSMKINDFAAAEDYIDKAIRISRNSTPALLAMAQLNYQMGAYDETRRRLSEIHRLGEPSSESLWLAARVERKLGNRSAELSYVTQLRRMFPESKESDELRQGRYE